MSRHMLHIGKGQLNQDTSWDAVHAVIKSDFLAEVMHTLSWQQQNEDMYS